MIFPEEFERATEEGISVHLIENDCKREGGKEREEEELP
jgi:hypothetical protein